MGERERSTRERILAAVLELAGREGLEALTTRRMAAEARVNVGLIHYYFASKDALVEEILGRFATSIIAAAEAAAAGRESAREGLTELFVAAFEYAARRPGLIFGIAERIVRAAAGSVRGGVSGLGASTALPAPIDPMRDFILGKVLPLLAEGLGQGGELARRRALQLYTSLFHPFLFTPMPAALFGQLLDDEAARRAYVEAVVADALAPPAPIKPQRRVSS